MSQVEFEKARKHLEQAKQEMLWLLAVLDDPQTSLKEYQLSQKEREQLYQECLAEMQELLFLFLQGLSKRVHIHVESKTSRVAEPALPEQLRIGEVTGLAGSMRLEVIGPGGPPVPEKRRIGPPEPPVQKIIGSGGPPVHIYKRKSPER